MADQVTAEQIEDEILKTLRKYYDAGVDPVTIAAGIGLAITVIVPNAKDQLHLLDFVQRHSAYSKPSTKFN